MSPGTGQEPGHGLGQHGLGAHCIGKRVIVRRVLPGETGPTGGPRMTDLLGVMESWAGGITTVRHESGTVTAIRIAEIVSGKPVPPRPSVRMRVSAEEAERRALASWPATVTEPLGAWVLRAAEGFSTRANSVLAVGDPGLPFTSAVAAVQDFFARHGVPACAQVIVDSDVHAQFAADGWIPARPGADDTLFQITSVSTALRGLRRSTAARPLALSAAVTPAWLANDELGRWHGEAALAVLEAPDDVVFASLAPDGRAGRDQVIAKGRAAYDDDWVGVTDVWVSPDHRRQGLSLAVMRALLEWGAERGAATAYLQVRGDNAAAVRLYEQIGFTTHHAYRYLLPVR